MPLMFNTEWREKKTSEFLLVGNGKNINSASGYCDVTCLKTSVSAAQSKKNGHDAFLCLNRGK